MLPGLVRSGAVNDLQPSAGFTKPSSNRLSLPLTSTCALVSFFVFAAVFCAVRPLGMTR